jgi:hypothetical protein
MKTKIIALILIAFIQSGCVTVAAGLMAAGAACNMSLECSAAVKAVNLLEGSE